MKVIVIMTVLLISSCASWVPYRYEPLQSASFSDVVNHALSLERENGALQQKLKDMECK